MTNTKEDQMRADFARLHNAPMLFSESFEKTRQDFNRGWKACAEFYENKLASEKIKSASADLQVRTIDALLAEANAKLAEKDAKIKELEDNERAYETIIGKKSYREVADELSEANARNAMLVDALETADRNLHWRISKVDQETITDALELNSEAVAAWEAEKLDSAYLCHKCHGSGLTHAETCSLYNRQEARAVMEAAKINREEQQQLKQQYEDIGEHGPFCGCYFCNPIV